LSRNLDVIHPRHGPLANKVQNFLRLLREAAAMAEAASRRAKHRAGIRK
jgi:hypothetical protein